MAVLRSAGRVGQGTTGAPDDKIERPRRRRRELVVEEARLRAAMDRPPGFLGQSEQYRDGKPARCCQRAQEGLLTGWIRCRFSRNGQDSFAAPG
jgi:hypothetical protein